MTIAAEQFDLEGMNSAFAAADPQKIVSWAASSFGQDLVMTSSFGAESAVLLHMATRAIPDIKSS